VSPLCALGTPIDVPTGIQPRLHERLAASPENIAPLRRAVTAYAGDHGATVRQLEDVALAVSEAVSNAVLHAYIGRVPGHVEVDAWIAGERLHVIVGDDGSGMRPRADSPGLRMGLSLIGLVTDRLELESRDAAPGTRVRMTFAIG
jgi:serine/threonine-protein kinase RsbW/stage II sporulation protein AB (anti-sigma F factor)